MVTTKARAQGRREYQEDRMVVFDADQNGSIVAAVMDGHGGSTVCTKVAKNLPLLWKEHDDIGKGADAVIEEVYAGLNSITEHMHDGSTMSLAYVTSIDGGLFKATVAVLGDSPVIAKKADGDIYVAPMHNARSNPSELLAAQARGAFFDGNYVYAGWSSGYGIQMTRVFGDGGLAKILNRKPEIQEVILAPGGWLLVGSDGLFDPTHKNINAEIQTVVELISKGAGARKLVNRAVNLPTHDNATAILVRF